MSKKDYQFLAAILNWNNAPFTLCKAIAEWLERDNPRFDRRHFMAKCGYAESAA